MAYAEDGWWTVLGERAVRARGFGPPAARGSRPPGEVACRGAAQCALAHQAAGSSPEGSGSPGCFK